MKKNILFTLIALGLASNVSAATVHTPTIDSGDTAWMLISSALVLFMTIPGLALFYGGLVRRKNVLNVFMQCFVLTAIVTIEWVAVGYSISYGSNSIAALRPFIGDLHWAFLQNIRVTDLAPYFISHSQIGADGAKIGTIPHFVFIVYQGMFAIITPALIIGSCAERIKFKGFVIFTLLWALFVYNPITHWVWSNDGWLFKLGALDFAGGTVVHVNSGIAAIVVAILLGKRRDYQGHALPPHNITYVMMGAAMLWVGWFGFNAGSGFASDGLAASAFLVTQVAAAAAALTWAVLDWMFDKHSTAVGIATGAVGGLVVITPAAGYVTVGSALIMGILVSLVCYYMVAKVKPKFGYDDALDAFGVHGVGGILGALLTGVFASPFIQAANSGAIYGNFKQLGIQALVVAVTILFSGVMTFILFKIVDRLVGIRVADRIEAVGLDETQHGETAYTEFD